MNIKMYKLLFIFFITLTTIVLAKHNPSRKYASHDQYSAIHDGWRNGWYVGQWDSLYTVMDTCSSCNMTYSIVTNVDGIYTIDSEDGMVTIVDSTNLSSGWDTLEIKSTYTDSYGSYSDTNYLWVNVLDEDSCLHVDPTAGSGGTGTVADPFDEWSDVDYTLAAYRGYFQKRGTTQSNDQLFIPSTDSGKVGFPKVMGAYNTGVRPIIDRNSTTAGQQCIDLRASNWQVYEYHLKDADENMFVAAEEHGTDQSPINLIISDISSDNGFSGDGQIYLFEAAAFEEAVNRNIILKDIYTTGSQNGYGIKMSANGVNISNTKHISEENFGISTSTNGSRGAKNYIYEYILIKDSQSGSGALELAGQNGLLTKSIIRNNNSGDNITISEANSANIIIDSCYIDNQSQWNGIDINPITYSPGGCRAITIRYCNISNSTQYGIRIRLDSDSISIHNNVIYNNTRDGIYSDNSDNDSLYIDYNVLYNNTLNDIDIYKLNSELKVRNNTFTGTVENTSGVNMDFKNNIYGSISGSNFSPNINNKDYDNILGSTHFIDSANNNFDLLATAEELIDSATVWGQTYDFLGRPISGTPDIGAFEYQSISSCDTVNSTDQIEVEDYYCKLYGVGVDDNRIWGLDSGDYFSVIIDFASTTSLLSYSIAVADGQEGDTLFLRANSENGTLLDYIVVTEGTGGWNSFREYQKSSVISSQVTEVFFVATAYGTCSVDWVKWSVPSSNRGIITVSSGRGIKLMYESNKGFYYTDF